MRPLQGVKVLDLTQRLPGPLATKLLADLGATVMKVEDQVLKDSFLDSSLAIFDESFADWYRELNRKKQVIRLDFKAPTVQTELAPRIKWADIILLGLSDNLALQLGLGQVEAAQLPGPKVILTLAASRNHKTALHDLNALAETGLLDMHVAGQTHSPLAPPFLPMAGIAFGQQVALSALAHWHHASNQGCCVISKVFMQEEIEAVFRPFWSQHLRSKGRTKFLHNGAYPCYCLYRSKDGDWVAVATVEQKFWRAFVQQLGLSLSDEQRFAQGSGVFTQVSQAIAAHTSEELKSLLVDKDICVSLVRQRA